MNLRIQFVRFFDTLDKNHLDPIERLDVALPEMINSAHHSDNDGVEVRFTCDVTESDWKARLLNYADLSLDRKQFERAAKRLIESEFRESAKIESIHWWPRGRFGRGANTG